MRAIQEAMSRKQEIYWDLLQRLLRYFRSVSALRWWHVARRRELHDEAELIHNLPVTLLEPAFVDHDIWFLNVQARWDLEHASQDSPNFEANESAIAELFRLVPEDMRHRLRWPGPRGDVGPGS
jgi:hypothetical protein